MQAKLNTFFDRVYVINLKSRLDRRAEVCAQLQRIGLNFDSPGVVLREVTKPTDAAGFPSVGARGCFMSHLAVLREAKEERLTSVLILEDDLNFCDQFSSRFSAVAQQLKTVEWGMFYGVYVLDAPLEDSASPCLKVDPRLVIGTSAFVAINGEHIHLLVDYLAAMLKRPAGDAHGGPMHIDGAYQWFRQSHPQISTWLAHDQLGFQRSSRTDVHSVRWYDRASWSAWIVSRLRRLRNRTRR